MTEIEHNYVSVLVTKTMVIFIAPIYSARGSQLGISTVKYTNVACDMDLDFFLFSFYTCVLEYKICQSKVKK